MIIYKVVNAINGKCYIGQTTQSLGKRKVGHKFETKNGTTYFSNALRKYGFKNFKWEVIEECDDKEQLDEMEFHYIKQYNSFKPEGYNLTLGGDKGTFGWKPTKENKEKIGKGVKKAWIKMDKKTKSKQIKKLSNFWSENHPTRGKKRPEIYGENNPAKKPEVRKKISKNVSKAMEKFNYEVISPQGKVFKITNMKKFCRENNLSSCSMFKLCDGKVLQGHHKQWRAKKLGLIKEIKCQN